MRKKIFYLLLAVILTGISSCVKDLDILPDNRAELNNTEKIAKILVSAYPQSTYVVPAELASDNTDEQQNLTSYSSRFTDELYNWKPSTELLNNDGLDRLWSSSYIAIASANAALQAIIEVGSPSNLDPQRGEALVARAYNHFILVNMFAQHYSNSHSSSDIGIVYMTMSETILNPKYDRLSVKETYDLIIKDLEEGLPLISDASYTNSSSAKYHFNKKAAYTFASRVYLYMGQWEKAAAYASVALGSDIRNDARNYTYIAGFGTAWANLAREYNSSSDKANYLISAPTSSMGVIFGPYGSESRYNHGWLIGITESVFVRTPYSAGSLNDINYRVRVLRYSGSSLFKFLFPRVLYAFEVSDPIAGIGFWRGVFSPFTWEEALLNRAEANIQLKKYSEALADMQVWAINTVNVNYTITEATVNTWANSFREYTSTVPTPIKKINPDFSVDPGTQQNMIHAILFMRRVQFLHTGLRWFDVKRYGIEISRRLVNGESTILEEQDKLMVRDLRRAFQIPQDVIDAGLTPNPR